MKGFGGPTQAPAWVTHGLVPLINLGLALVIAGIIIALIGENPFEALKLLVLGAVGYRRRSATPFTTQPISSSPGSPLPSPSTAASSTSAARGRPTWVGSAPG